MVVVSAPCVRIARACRHAARDFRALALLRGGDGGKILPPDTRKRLLDQGCGRPSQYPEEFDRPTCAEAWRAEADVVKISGARADLCFHFRPPHSREADPAIQPCAAADASTHQLLRKHAESHDPN